MKKKEIIEELFGIREPSYYKHKREGRKIIQLVEKYFDNDELEEFLKNGSISKYDDYKYLLKIEKSFVLPTIEKILDESSSNTLNILVLLEKLNNRYTLLRKQHKEESDNEQGHVFTEKYYEIFSELYNPLTGESEGELDPTTYIDFNEYIANSIFGENLISLLLGKKLNRRSIYHIQHAIIEIRKNDLVVSILKNLNYLYSKYKGSAENHENSKRKIIDDYNDQIIDYEIAGEEFFEHVGLHENTEAEITELVSLKNMLMHQYPKSTPKEIWDLAYETYVKKNSKQGAIQYQDLLDTLPDDN